jgi:hypothetical protein
LGIAAKYSLEAQRFTPVRAIDTTLVMMKESNITNDYQDTIPILSNLKGLQ